jgi:hypothetical protein
MTDLGPGGRLVLRMTHEPALVNRIMRGFGTVGVVAALVGIVIGLVMATHRIQVPCSGDSAGPCYSYPEAGVGASFALVSFVLGTLVILACIVLMSIAALRKKLGLRR